MYGWASLLTVWACVIIIVRQAHLHIQAKKGDHNAR